ncbi:MAG TPA: glycosyltransferase family 39 protein, partial [Anaerolineae bacterium]|nr:glycosyltransferase family 39 protein [Anaerolineae bacterium]
MIEGNRTLGRHRLRRAADKPMAFWLLIVTFITVLALGLRLWGSGFGLPNIFARPDESFIVPKALAFGAGDLNPHFFHYPTFYMYLLFGVYVGYAAFGLLTGRFTSVTDIQHVFLLQPESFYLLGRWLTIGMGTATVIVLYLGSQQHYGWQVAALASFFLALAPLHVRDSHFITTDVPATIWIILAFVFSMRYVQKGGIRDGFVAGLAAGLATSTKYNAAMIGLPLLLACVYRARAVRHGKWQLEKLWHTGWPLAVMVVAFFLGSPFILLDPGTFWRDLTYEWRHLGQGHGLVLSIGFVHHLRFSLRYGLGLPLLLMAVGGLLLALCRRRPADVLLVSFVLGYYLLIGSGRTVFVRYVIPLVPFLCLAAADALNWGTAWLVRRGWLPGRWSGIVLALAGLLIVAPGGYNTVQQDRLLSRTDTRVMATDWIEAHVPDNSVIAMQGGDYGEPQVWESRSLLEEKVAYPGSEIPGHGSRRRLQALLALPDYPPGPAYYVLRLRDYGNEGASWILTEYDVDRLHARGVSYVVITDHFLPYSRADQTLEAALQQQARLVAEFSPTRPGAVPQPVFDPIDAFYVPLADFTGIERPGPFIRIYTL